MTPSSASLPLPAGGDFTPLAGAEQSTRYFQQLERVFTHLLRCYPSEKDAEARVMREFLSSLLRTIKVLELKYTCPMPDTRPLFIDITESGFPNHLEIADVETDLRRKADRLRELPTSAILKRQLVDALLESRSELEILRLLSERSYFEALDEGSLFLGFTPGELSYFGEEERVRKYGYTFGCFDFTTNRPYVTLMLFDQDTSAPPLHETSAETEQLRAIIRRHGSRAPQLAILAMSIDESIETIHPKAFKRICIGPLYARALLERHRPNPEDPREAYFQALLNEAGRHEDDYICLLTQELVFSRRQDVTKSPFGKRAREIYAVEETDAECAERKVSGVQRFYLMPHELLQHLDPARSTRLTDFAKARKLSVDEEGDIHGL